eukprot:scaffold2654_cov202-Prasinococcus_capsulatus_cf.AAC.2
MRPLRRAPRATAAAPRSPPSRSGRATAPSGPAGTTCERVHAPSRTCRAAGRWSTQVGSGLAQPRPGPHKINANIIPVRMNIHIH